MQLLSKRTAKVTGINLIILAIAFIGMEAFCRWQHIPYSSEITPTENAVARFDPVLGWSYIPNLSKTIQFGDNQRKVVFDAQSIRVPDPGFRFDDNRPSILFIGGSFTMGHGLSFEETFPGQLHANTHFPLQVVNLGVQAYGTDQALLALKKYIPRFNTKVVVYTFINQHVFRNGNYDRRTLYPQASFLGTKPLFGFNGRGELVLKKSPLRYEDYHNSWLWDAGKLAWRQKMGHMPPYPVTLTHALIKNIEAVCIANNARLIVLHWKVTPYEPPNVLAGLDVMKIDLQSNIPDLRNLIIPGDGHPNTRAHEAVARVLFKALKPLSSDGKASRTFTHG